MDEDRDTGLLRMGGLRYQEAPEPVPGQVPRPLTVDDKVRNFLFHRLCLRAWKEERAEAEAAAAEQAGEERRIAAEEEEVEREKAAEMGREQVRGPDGSAKGGAAADDMDDEEAQQRAMKRLGV